MSVLIIAHRLIQRLLETIFKTFHMAVADNTSPFLMTASCRPSQKHYGALTTASMVGLLALLLTLTLISEEYAMEIAVGDCSKHHWLTLLASTTSGIALNLSTRLGWHLVMLTCSSYFPNVLIKGNSVTI